MRIVLLLTLLLFGCKEEIINPKKSMYKFETIDTHKEYKFQCIQKTILNYNFTNPFGYEILTLINDDATLPDDFEQMTLRLDVKKKIIPLYLVFYFDIPTDLQIVTPYYKMGSLSTQDYYSLYLPSLLKIQPYISPIGTITPDRANYLIKYNDLLYNESDFIDVTQGVNLNWGTTLNSVLNNNDNFIMYGGSVGVSNLTTSFYYLELQ